MAISRIGSQVTLTSVSGFFWTNGHQLELLGNGNLVAMLATSDPGNPGMSGTRYKSVVVLNDSGVTQGATSTFLTTPATTFDGQFDIASLSTGAFTIAWNTGPEGGGSPDDEDVLGRTFSATGTPSAANFPLPNDPSAGEFSPEVVALSNGNYLYMWSDLDSITGPNPDGDIVAQIMTPAGVDVGAEFQVNATSTGLQFDPDAVTLSDGRIAVMWTNNTLLIDPGSGQPTGLDPTGFGGRFLSAAGVPQGADFNLGVTPLAGLDFTSESDVRSLVATANGGFALTWVETSQDTNATSATFALRAQFFSNAGVAIGSPTLVRQQTGVNTQTTNGFSAVEAFVRPDGSLAIAWEESQPFSAPVVHLAVVDTAGTVAIPATNLNTAWGFGLIGQVTSVEMLPDGTLMALVVSTNPQTSTATYSTIKFNVSIGGSLNIIDGTPGPDNPLNGTTGDDQINGFANNDLLNGLDGDDVLIGGAGADTLDGGSNTAVGDTASYETSSVGVYVDLEVNFVTGGDATGDVISNFENVAGGAGADVLIGSGGNNTFRGNGGSDYIYSGEGFDSVSGNDGNDVLFGDGGNDTVNGGAGIDYVFGGAGSNTLSGGAGIDIIVIDGIFDTAFGGTDAVGAGGTGDVNYFYVTDTAFNPTVWGDGAQDIYIDISGVANVAVTFNGGNGGDYVFAGGGGDAIFGDGGDDVLWGDGGNDTLNAGTGTNYATGGAGNDTFVVNASDGIVLINDFVGGGTDDTVRLIGTTFTSFTQVQAALTPVGSGMILTVDANTSVWFLGLNTTSLTASDFTFV